MSSSLLVEVWSELVVVSSILVGGDSVVVVVVVAVVVGVRVVSTWSKAWTTAWVGMVYLSIVPNTTATSVTKFFFPFLYRSS